MKLVINDLFKIAFPYTTIDLELRIFLLVNDTKLVFLG